MNADGDEAASGDLLVPDQDVRRGEIAGAGFHASRGNAADEGALGQLKPP